MKARRQIEHVSELFGGERGHVWGRLKEGGGGGKMVVSDQPDQTRAATDLRVHRAARVTDPSALNSARTRQSRLIY